MPATQIDGWGEYRKLILSELERLTEEVQGLNKKLEDFRKDELRSIHVEIATLKVKASLYGALAGGIGGGLAWLLSKAGP